MTVGTVTPIRQDSCTVTIGTAIGAFLATIGRPESRGTHRQYAATLRRFRDRFGGGHRARRARGRGDLGPAGTGHLQPGDRRVPLRVRLLGRAGLARHRSHPAAAAPPDPPGQGPGPCPAPASSRCWPAMTSACARRRCGGCCMRPPPGPGKSSRSTLRTWTSPTAARRSAARAARSTSSSGRPAPPACCPA